MPRASARPTGSGLRARGSRGTGGPGKGPGAAPTPSVPLLSRPQLDNLVLINKIKEQLMAEKIRPPHLPPTSASSQQPLLVPPAPAESSQAVMSLPKLQQVPGLHPQAVPQPDVALHARPATSTVTGTAGREWAGPARTGRGGGSPPSPGPGQSGRTTLPSPPQPSPIPPHA